MAETLSTNLLQQGSQGDDVTQLQNALTGTGDYTGKVDGDFGPITGGAVSSYQNNNNISPTGTATPETISSIYAPSQFQLPTLSDTGFGGRPQIDMINQMAEQQRLASLGGIQSAFEQGRVGLEGDVQGVQPQFSQLAGAQNAAYMQNAKRITEQMAQMGLGEGQALSQQSRLTTQNQQALSGLARDKQQQYSDLGRERRLLDIGYQGDVASSMGDIEESRMNRMYSLYQQHPEWAEWSPGGRKPATGGSGGGSTVSAAPKSTRSTTKSTPKPKPKPSTPRETYTIADQDIRLLEQEYERGITPGARKALTPDEVVARNYGAGQYNNRSSGLTAAQQARADLNMIRRDMGLSLER
jgi:peptidoglycan hydrolase-like protein with peptidoglycan-binding domain